MTAPAVETVMPPEGLRVTPAGTPVLVASGNPVVLDGVVVLGGGGGVVVVVEGGGGVVELGGAGVVGVLEGVVVVGCGLGYQVRLGCDVRGEP
jgi:hypothetical protein